MSPTTKKHKFLTNYKSSTTGKPVRKGVIEKELKKLDKLKDEGAEFTGVIFGSNEPFSPETEELLARPRKFLIRKLPAIPLRGDDDE